MIRFKLNEARDSGVEIGKTSEVWVSRGMNDWLKYPLFSALPLLSRCLLFRRGFSIVLPAEHVEQVTVQIAWWTEQSQMN